MCVTGGTSGQLVLRLALAGVKQWGVRYRRDIGSASVEIGVSGGEAVGCALQAGHRVS